VPPPLQRALALTLGLGLSAAAVAALEVHFRREETSLVYLWDSGRRFATRPGVGGSNAQSYHERALERAGARRDIVVLGDSMTWGTSAEEAWPRVWESTLTGRRVWNLSHYGYDVAQAGAVLAEDGWGLDPALVVYAAYTNDPIPSRIIDVAGRPVWVGPDMFWFRRSSALVRRLEGAWLAPSAPKLPDWTFYTEELQKMAAACAARGVPLVVLGLVPHVLSHDAAECSTRLARPGHCEGELAIAAEQARISAGLGLQHVPTRAAWLGLDVGDTPGDWQHPGVEGHRLLGRYVAGVLADTTAGLP
jgi:hypothetical protein